MTRFYEMRQKKKKEEERTNWIKHGMDNILLIRILNQSDLLLE